MSRDNEPTPSNGNQSTVNGSDNNDRDIARLTVDIIRGARDLLDDDDSTLAQNFWEALGSITSVQTIGSYVQGHLERMAENRLSVDPNPSLITATVSPAIWNESSVTINVDYYDHFNPHPSLNGPIELPLLRSVLAAEITTQVDDDNNGAGGHVDNITATYPNGTGRY
nr:hypothetical protein L203_06677 [Cryptococcus depauperatus CBS 7841]